MPWPGPRSSTSSPSWSSACTSPHTVGTRHRRARHHHRPGDLRRADGRHRLEHRHLAGRHPLVIVARPDRRPGRRGRGQGGLHADRVGRRGQDRRRPSCVSPAIGLRPGAAAGADRVLDLRARRRRARRTGSSAGCSSSPPRSIRWATAATTRRRPWASSPCCCSPTAAGTARFHVPLWVVLACQAAMALGTLFGGWRIVRTMGSRITRLTPMQGVCAETAGAITLFWRHLPGHSGLHHPHHHRRHRRRRRGAARLGGALERGQGHRGGLGRHHARGRADRRRCSILLAGAFGIH